MKKIRKLSVLLLTTLLCFLFSGCYSMVMDSVIEADGSGTIQVSAGISESFYYMMYESEQEENPTDQTFEEYLAEATQSDGLIPYTYNGSTYWGEIESVPFASVEEFNSFMFADEEGIPDGTGSLAVDEKGDYILTLILTPESAEETGAEEEEMTEEDLAMMKELMPMDFIFQLPETIGKASGNTACYRLDGNVVTIDLLAAMAEIEKNPEKLLTFVFSTAEPTFVDTPVTMWYTAAAEAMAEGGLMAGTGNNCFAPDQNLTVGELAQILARATGLDVGTGETGYWAEIAVESCLAKGYITDRGEVNQANYGVPVDRQEAIAAMQRASGLKPSGTLTAEDIPDFASIKDAFKQDILDAYNTGITAGVDANRTCGPDLNLTRAQVAQLFYALGWTTPLK